MSDRIKNLLTYLEVLPILSINLCKFYAKNGGYMLINFKFSNYKSFKDEAEFSMEPLTNNGSINNAIEIGYRKAPCVYRTSAIFGANASGKSNFIEAMNYALCICSFVRTVNLQNTICRD